ncbi:MAG: ATP-binding protein [Pseudomonadota bacterium]
MTALALEFDSTAEDGHAILMAATGFLETQGAYDPDIELALAEAINNIVDHAYADPGLAALRLETSQTDVVCVLTDSGQTFVPPGMDHAPGYGWHLIRALTKAVNVQRLGETNRMTLIFQRPDLA